MARADFQALLPFEGFSIGHYTDESHGTGCTAVLCPDGAVGGVDVRGGGPGTRETALLDPVCKVDIAHGVMLSGGSAFGLGAADGAMRWLEERGCGYEAGPARVPIVPSAIIFDLGVGPLKGNLKPRPDARAGYLACAQARPSEVAEGSVGAGTGATVGKFLGMERCSKGGLGTAALRLENGLRVGAIVVVNALGNVKEGESIIAGARDPGNAGYVDFNAFIHGAESELPDLRNTTIGVVLTNAALSKAEATRVAQMAHSGISRAVDPSHTPHDGDTLFVLATRQMPADVGRTGALAAACVEAAIVRAVRTARPLFDIPSTAGVKPSPAAG